MMSVQQYEQLRLTAEQEPAVHNAIASAQMEGQYATGEEKQALREFAAGKITGEQYLLHRLLPEYYPNG